MNKDSSDFMLEEYDRISTAYFGLRNQVNEWFKAYVALIGLPLTILAAVIKISNDNSSMGLSDFPIIVSALLMVVSFLGFFITLSIINMRMEMILYARTINDIRRYFAELDLAGPETEKRIILIKYLILPTCDRKPPFYEEGRAIFWQVLLLGVFDGAIFLTSFHNITDINWIISAVAGVLFGGFHWLVYKLIANQREKKWEEHFNKDLTESNS